MNTNHYWRTRTLPFDQIRSRRPANWDMDADVTTAILQGASAHIHVKRDGIPSGEYLIAVPMFSIIYRGNRVEVQPNQNGNIPAVEKGAGFEFGWVDVPFAKLPGDVIDLLMLTYTQFGYKDYVL